ncbi:hypothetical protein BJ170DRAFT_446035 [Xylariales sp. AK1849]|nr:hypothetical protein BJ170DRAFT_446035 [Xylariales sp. AK1849]
MSLAGNSHTHLFANASFFVALMPTFVGINAILRPASALSMLKFSAPPQPEGQKLARSLLQMHGARNLTKGLMMLGIWYSGDYTTLGYAMLAQMPVAIVDGFMSRSQIGGGEWGHWPFALVGLGLGLGCLGVY